MSEVKIKDVVQYIMDFQKQLNDEVKWLRKLRINQVISSRLGTCDFFGFCWK